MWYQWQWLSWIMKCVLGLVGNGEGAMREEVRCNQSRWAAAKRGNCITGTLGGEWQKPNFRLKTNHKWLGTSFKCMKDWVAAVLSWMSGSTQTFHFCFSHPEWYHLQSLKLASPLFDRGRTKVKYNGWTHLFLTSYLFALETENILRGKIWLTWFMIRAPTPSAHWGLVTRDCRYGHIVATGGQSQKKGSRRWMAFLQWFH